VLFEILHSPQILKCLDVFQTTKYVTGIATARTEQTSYYRHVRNEIALQASSNVTMVSAYTAVIGKFSFVSITYCHLAFLLNALVTVVSFSFTAVSQHKKYSNWWFVPN